MEPNHEHVFGLETLRRLHQVIGRLNGLDTLGETLQAVADGVVAVVNFEVAVVSLLHADRTLETVAVAGSSRARSELLGNRTPMEDLDHEFAVAENWGALRFVSHERMPEGPMVGWVPDIEIDDAEDAWHPLDALYAPLHNRSGDLVGLLSVDLPRDRRRPGGFQRELLEMFADQAGIAVNNARVADRLKSSEETFRLAFNGAGTGMSLIGLDQDDPGRYLEVNPALCRLLGYSQDQMLRKSVLDVTHPDDQAPDRLALARMSGGDEQIYTTQKRYVRADGTSIWVAVNTTVLLGSGSVPASAMTVVEDISERHRKDAELNRLARHDELTGLPNRRVLPTRLTRAIDRAHTEGVPGAVLFCDLDNFKAVNDAHGHGIGDQVLAIVANRIGRTIRTKDTAIRVGGDEFVIIADAITQEQTLALIERLSAAIAEPIRVGRLVVQIRMSVGMTVIESDEPGDVEELLRAADNSMYDVKRDRPPNEPESVLS